MPQITHMNQSCHPHERVTPHAWISHVTGKVWMTRIARKNESCHTYECVTPHTWISHVTGKVWMTQIAHMNASNHTYKEVKSQVKSHTTDPSYVNDSCQTYEWVMPHVRMRHVSHEPLITNEWLRLHIWMSHATHTNASRHTWKTNHVWMTQITHINVSPHTCRSVQLAYREFREKKLQVIKGIYVLHCATLCCKVLQSVAVRYNVLHNVFQCVFYQNGPCNLCVVVCCSVLQCAAVCCSVL